MTHLDNLIADALAQSPDTVVHQLATDRERLRGELEAARAEIADLRTIPADRVLGEGEARIGMNELQMLRCFAGRRMSEREYDRLEAVRDAHEEALRANQGGAAT